MVLCKVVVLFLVVEFVIEWWVFCLGSIYVCVGESDKVWVNFVEFRGFVVVMKNGMVFNNLCYMVVMFNFDLDIVLFDC